MRVLLASHAYMAKGVASSVKLILGEVENLEYISAYTDEECFEKQLREKLSNKNEEEKLVIITDLLGGSVNNEVLSVIQDYSNVFLITGMNLIMVISILLAEEDTIENELESIVKNSREGIIYFNENINNSNFSFDEF